MEKMNIFVAGIFIAMGLLVVFSVVYGDTFSFVFSLGVCVYSCLFFSLYLTTNLRVKAIIKCPNCGAETYKESIENCPDCGKKVCLMCGRIKSIGNTGKYSFIVCSSCLSNDWLQKKKE